jgi:hypothetical protein
MIASVAVSALLLLPAWLPAAASGDPAQAATGGLVWSILSPSSSPPPLEYASAVYDSDNKTIVLFGGLTAQGTVSDSTFVWNGSTWTDYSPAQIEEPPPRYLASMAFDPALHQLILFGGRDPAGHPLDDTWAWNGASWYNVAGRYGNVSPSPRDAAALSYDGQGHLVLFGGEAPGSGGTSPSSSAGTGTTTAGVAAQTLPSNPQGPLSALSDTWQWGPTGWTQVPALGPPARAGAGIAYDATHNDVVMFGGAAGLGGATGTTQLADTWLWNGSTWSQAPAGSAPPGRSSAVMSDDPVAGGVVLSGGSSGAAPLADTWMWDGSAWSQLATSGSAVGRSGASGAFDPATRQLVVFGGRGPDGSLLGTTVVLTAGAPLPLGSVVSMPSTTIPLPGTSRSTPQTTGAPAAASPAGAGSTPQRSRVLPATAGAPTAGKSKAIPVLRRGELVTLTGSGFSPNVELTITFHSKPVLVGRTLTDGRGDFVATVPVPLKASGGTHHFEASGLTPTGPATLVVATVVVAGTSLISTPSLSETLALVLIALGLPLGTWLLLGARSRLRQRVG